MLAAIGRLGPELAAPAVPVSGERPMILERWEPDIEEPGFRPVPAALAALTALAPPFPGRASDIQGGVPDVQGRVSDVQGRVSDVGAPAWRPRSTRLDVASRSEPRPDEDSLLGPPGHEPRSTAEPTLPRHGPRRPPARPAGPLPSDPLRMRLKGRDLDPGPARARPASPAPDPRPRRLPRLDLTYRPAEGALRLPGAVQENRQRPDQGGREPPMADRLIAPRRASPGIFRLTARGEPIYDGQVLRWRPGGRHEYRGPPGTFDASVGPDGGLAFRDHSSVSGPSSGRPAYSPPLEDPSTPHLKPSGGVAMFTVGTFDVTDAVMRRLGQDPYSAEKLRFAEATLRWRDGIRARFQEAIRRRVVAEAGRPGPLCRRYGAAPEARRLALRRELFQRWDECREDADGRAVREALVRAIRRCGIRYPDAELAQLNRGRRARVAFAP